MTPTPGYRMSPAQAAAEAAWWTAVTANLVRRYRGLGMDAAQAKSKASWFYWTSQAMALNVIGVGLMGILQSVTALLVLQVRVVTLPLLLAALTGTLVLWPLLTAVVIRRYRAWAARPCWVRVRYAVPTTVLAVVWSVGGHVTNVVIADQTMRHDPAVRQERTPPPRFGPGGPSLAWRNSLCMGIARDASVDQILGGNSSSSTPAPRTYSDEFIENLARQCGEPQYLPDICWAHRTEGKSAYADIWLDQAPEDIQDLFHDLYRRCPELG